MTHAELHGILERNREDLDADIMNVMEHHLERIKFGELAEHVPVILEIAEIHGQAIQETLVEMYQDIYKDLEYKI
jgi:hypothetical protein